MTLFLVDASHYQSDLPVSTLRDLGFVGLILKATEGRQSTDSSFARLLAAGRSAGLLVAGYHFLHSDSTSGLEAQAAHTVTVVPPDVPVWVDVEAGASRAEGEAYAAALRAHGRVVAGLYCASQPSSGFGWWRAAYGIDPSGRAGYAYTANGGDSSRYWNVGSTRHPDIWQFCQHGVIAGYGGDVDLNAYRGTLQQLVATGWFWVPDALKGADLVLDEKTLEQLREMVRGELGAALSADIVPPGEYRPDLVNKDPSTGGQGIGPVLLAAARNSIDANGSLGYVANQLGAITVTLAAIQAQQPDLNVDVKALAQQIAAALPPDLAQELADELARRLAS